MDYTPARLASILGVHVDTVRRLARAGRLPGYKVGRLWRFPSEDVELMRRRLVDDPGDIGPAREETPQPKVQQ